jgi:hypothetical protein
VALVLRAASSETNAGWETCRGQNEPFTYFRIATAVFSKSLAEHGIPHSFEIYANGDHRNKVKERLENRAFIFFSEKLIFGPMK